MTPGQAEGLANGAAPGPCPEPSANGCVTSTDSVTVVSVTDADDSRPNPEPPAPDCVETAWRMHATLIDWTGRVDNKASFALAIESAVLLAVVGLAGEGRRLSAVDGWAAVWLWCGVLLLVGSVLSAAAAVRPALTARGATPDGPRDFIYFGHLKHWDPGALEEALREREILPILARQCVAMAQITWLKHRLLQTSLWAAVVGTALLALAALLNG